MKAILKLLIFTALLPAHGALASSFRGNIGVSPSGIPMATVRVIAKHPQGQGSAEIFVNEDRTLAVFWCHQPEGGCVIGVLVTLRKVF